MWMLPWKNVLLRFFFLIIGGRVILFTQVLNFLELIEQKNSSEASFSPLTAMPTANGWS